MDNLFLSAVRHIFSRTHKSELPVRFLLDTLYLSDWKSAIEKHGKTISKLNWVKSDCSPFSDEALDILKSAAEFKVSQITKDENRWIIKIEPSSNVDSDRELSSKDISILNFATDCSLRSDSSENLVSLTYPMLAGDDVNIDMRAMAKDYIKNIRPRLRKNL